MSEKNAKLEALKQVRVAFGAADVDLNDADVRVVEQLFHRAKKRAKPAASAAVRLPYGRGAAARQF